MGKVNGLWMDLNLDVESHDVTGEAIMEAMAEARLVIAGVSSIHAAESSHHRFDDMMAFCEKCGRTAHEITEKNTHGHCTGMPLVEPMVRVMKMRTR